MLSIPPATMQFCGREKNPTTNQTKEKNTKEFSKREFSKREFSKREFNRESSARESSREREFKRERVQERERENHENTHGTTGNQCDIDRTAAIVVASGAMLCASLNTYPMTKHDGLCHHL
jgi:hypothetical protein